MGDANQNGRPSFWVVYQSKQREQLHLTLNLFLFLGWNKYKTLQNLHSLKGNMSQQINFLIKDAALQIMANKTIYNLKKKTRKLQGFTITLDGVLLCARSKSHWTHLRKDLSLLKLLLHLYSPNQDHQSQSVKYKIKRRTGFLSVTLLSRKWKHQRRPYLGPTCKRVKQTEGPREDY